MPAKKILLIEDDKSLMESYSMLLLAEGYEVARAGDGQEGIQRTREFKPDLILLDLLMPVHNGIEYLRELKTTAEPHGKIIVMTNLNTLEIELEAKKLGADGYYVKSSLSPKELAELLKTELSSDD